MKRIITLLLVSLGLTACAQIQPAPPVGSKTYGSTPYISPDGLIWFGTNPLKYRSVYPKTKVDSLLALIPVIDTSLFYTKTASNARFVSLTGSYANPTWITSLAYSKLTGAPNLGLYQLLSEKTQPNGYPSLNSSGFVPPAQLNANTARSNNTLVQRDGAAGINVTDINSDGVLTLSLAPVTSLGSYEILTRNTSTGKTEKIPSSTLTGFVPYTGATGDVDLGTHSLNSGAITASGSVTSVGVSSTGNITTTTRIGWGTAGSTSRTIANNSITGTTLYPGVGSGSDFRLLNGSGTPVFTVPTGTTNILADGNITANSFIKSGGTSSQFLKADGSVDNNTYLTSIPTLQQVLTTGNASTVEAIISDGTATTTVYPGVVETYNPTSTEYLSVRSDAASAGLEYSGGGFGKEGGISFINSGVDYTVQVGKNYSVPGDFVGMNWSTLDSLYITDAQNSKGMSYSANYDTKGLADPNWIPSLRAVKSLISASGGGTVTSFGKVDGFGITSSVANSTTTPVHTIAVDTTAVRSVLNSYTKAQTNTQISTALSGYELLSNKSTSTSLGTSNTLYPTQNAVKTYVDGLATNYVNTTGNQSNIAGVKEWLDNQFLAVDKGYFTTESGGSSVNMWLGKLTSEHTDGRSSQYAYDGMFLKTNASGAAALLKSDNILSTQKNFQFPNESGTVVVSNNTVSSAGTLGLTTSGYYTFNGTTATWTLPTISGNTGVRLVLISRGSGNITLNSNAGGNDIDESGVSMNTMAVPTGTTLVLYNNGLKWVIIT